ncbi:MAG: CopL family metal-binding regulatory protein [Pseudomonadota bacterium]
MHPGSAPFPLLRPLRLLRLLLAVCLLLGGWAAASAHMGTGGGQGGSGAIPCHGQDGAVAASAHDHPAMGMAAAPAAHALPALPLLPAPDGCCGSSGACHAHCGLGAALPVAQAALPAPPIAHLVRRHGSQVRYAPPAPDRLIRPPISA